MNPLSLSPAARQNALARSLYRKLFRECQRLPPNASLVHLDQWVGDTQIKDQNALRSCLRSSFRRRNNTDLMSFSNNNQKQNNEKPNNRDEIEGKEGIRRAMEGLKYLLTFDLSKLSESETEARVSSHEDEMGGTLNNEGQHSYSLQSPISSDDLLRSVEWLPHVSEMKVTETESSEFPIFPLLGPLFPDDQGKRLPLLSQFSDTPVNGMEIPLRIFEPRYRKMYQDLLSSADTSSRKFIVPFPHPYRPGQFAAFGWIYEIVRVKDVADESNGVFQLVCNHIVTQPVKILGIINPEDYDTRSTYLRVRADILGEDEDEGNTEDNTEDTNSILRTKPSSADLQPLEELLHQLQNQPLSLSSDNNNRQIDKYLIDRLLMASGEGSIWPVVQVWILNLQTEILRLQMKISTRIQVQAKAEQQRSSNNNNNTEWQEFITEEMVSLAQEPYKSHLRCMLIEVSTLIPWLLQEESHKARCHQMCERIRERLVNETEKS
jgi:Lon protease-like protein